MNNFTIKKRFLLSIFMMVVSISMAQQNNIVFPPDAGVLDITKPPFNADPTGMVDATAIIQAALDSSNIVYLPNGTYLISNTINWPGRATRRMLWGQSRDGVVIKLKDNCEGYTSPSSTKAMIWTGERPAQRFENYVRNLTVNTGTGNAGATAIQFMANNVGGISDVLIKSDDGKGCLWP